MPRIQFTVRQLTQLYDMAVIGFPKHRCLKCWQTHFAFRCFKRQTEVYTYPSDAGLWVFDVDRARELVGVRTDGEIPADVILNALGESEPGHELCLAKRAAYGHLPPAGAVGIVATLPDGAQLIIDGTHRGKLCAAAGVSMSVAILSAAERDAVTIAQPPNVTEDVLKREAERMGDLFRNMDSDAFFEEIRDVIGLDVLRKLMTAAVVPVTPAEPNGGA